MSQEAARKTFTFLNKWGYLPMPETEETSDLASIAHELETGIKTMKDVNEHLQLHCRDMTDLYYDGDPMWWLAFVRQFIEADEYGKAVFISLPAQKAFAAQAFAAQNKKTFGVIKRIEQLARSRNSELGLYWKKLKAAQTLYKWQKDLYYPVSYEDEAENRREKEKKTEKKLLRTAKIKQDKKHKMLKRWKSFEDKNGRTVFPKRVQVADKLHKRLERGACGRDCYKRALFLETMIYERMRRLDADRNPKVKVEKRDIYFKKMYDSAIIPQQRAANPKRSTPLTCETCRTRFNVHNASHKRHTYGVGCNELYSKFPTTVGLDNMLKMEGEKTGKGKHIWCTASAWERAKKERSEELAFNWALLEEHVIRKRVARSLKFLIEKAPGHIPILMHFESLQEIDSFIYTMAPTMSAYINIAATIYKRLTPRAPGAPPAPPAPNSILDLLIVWGYQPYTMLDFFEQHSFDPDNFPTLVASWLPGRQPRVVPAKPVARPVVGGRAFATLRI